MAVKRISIVVALLALVLSEQAMHGQSKADFDRVVDLSLNLKELDALLEAGKEKSLNRGRFLLLNGTIADVSPKKSWFFLLSDSDLPDAGRFLRRIANAEVPLARALLGRLSGEVQEALGQLKSYAGPIPPELVAAVLKDLNNVLKKTPLARERGALEGLSLGADLREIIAADPTGEESAFLNRLLLEAVFPEDVLPITVTCELVSGEWIGLEEVKSYHGLIQVRGPASFLVFNRRRPSTVPGLAIPVNSRALIVATPETTVQSPAGGRVWVFKALYIRSLQ